MKNSKKVTSVMLSVIMAATMSACGADKVTFTRHDSVTNLLDTIDDLTIADDYLKNKKIEDADHNYKVNLDAAKNNSTNLKLAEISLKVLKAYIIDALDLDYTKVRGMNIDNRGRSLFDDLFCTIYYEEPLEQYNCLSDVPKKYEYNFRLDNTATEIYKIYFRADNNMYEDRKEFNNAYKKVLDFMLMKGTEKRQKLSFDYDEEKIERILYNR